MQRPGAGADLLCRELLSGKKCRALSLEGTVYAKAQQALEELPIRDVVSWSALITGCAQQGESEQALKCFERIQDAGLSPDTKTFACVIHHERLRPGLLWRNDIVQGTALVAMYAKCSALKEAQDVFDESNDRGIVSWTALLTGHVEYGRGEDALRCFEAMQVEGISPNAATFVCDLKACDSTKAAGKDQDIHAKVDRQGLLDINLLWWISDMYTKCNLLVEAQNVFDKL